MMAEKPTKAAKAAKAAPVRSEEPPAEPAEVEEEQAPMNRAERRAKGRGKTATQVPGSRGKVTGAHGPAHTQRNFANRRTG